MIIFVIVMLAFMALAAFARVYWRDDFLVPDSSWIPFRYYYSDAFAFVCALFASLSQSWRISPEARDVAFHIFCAVVVADVGLMLVAVASRLAHRMSGLLIIIDNEKEKEKEEPKS